LQIETNGPSILELAESLLRLQNLKMKRRLDFVLLLVINAYNFHSIIQSAATASFVGPVILEKYSTMLVDEFLDAVTQ
jgi:hypothetical protein